MKNVIKWTRDGLGFVCPHCGTPNPDRGDKCGNCEENPFILPSADAELTLCELITLNAVVRGR